MAEYPKFKVMIEGIQINVQKIVRVQTEGESSRLILYLWPTNQGTQIKRGSFITIFRFEYRSKEIDSHYSGLEASGKEGVWELFWDGYISRKPSISRRENRSLIIYGEQWANRLKSMYMRAHSMSTMDSAYEQDKAFMGINLKATGYFDYVGKEIESSITVIQNKIIKASGDIGQGMIDMIKAAVDWDDLYARIDSVANISNRFVSATNPTINKVLAMEGVAELLAGQIARMASSTTLGRIINDIMYQTLYTYISIPSPMLSYDEAKLNQFLYKPQLFFAAPIVSNLIFPGPIDSMEPVETSVNQPTRVMIELNSRIIGKDIGILQKGKQYFPQEISNMVLRSIDRDSPSLEFKDKFTDEELREDRIVPGRVQMPFADGLMHATIGESDITIAKIYGRYMYEIERNISEPIRVQMNFDPYLICGLSGAIFDEQFGYILGRIRSIQDNIDLVNRISKTSIEMANVRIVPGIKNGIVMNVADSEFQIENYDSLFGKIEDYGLFDQKYNNDRIGREFYEVYFGVGSVKDRASSFAAAMGSLFTNYKTVGENLPDFLQKIKHRPVVTEGEYMKFINASPADNGELLKLDSHNKYNGLYGFTEPGINGSVRPFMHERQNIIIQYVKDIEDAHKAKIA